MNSTNMTGTCPSAAGDASHKGDFAVALTLGIIHTALMVLAVVLAYAQLRRTPPRRD
jgi:ABC-type tungstate transport system substrate-binding protein